MNTGLITFHYAHHYGAQLQAFALMKAIMNTGAGCEIINYVRKDTIEGSGLFRKDMSIRALLSNANTLVNYRKLRRRYEKFDDFVKKDMKLSEKFYSSYEELRSDAPVYDAYVCGSDQIWNLLIFEEKTFDPAFFAEFADGGRRIAYAPSFGINIIPENNREELRSYLAKFECLSVRERQGEKIIRDISGRDSVTVLDPTLLLTGDEWSEFSAAPVFEQPYILCYFITDGRKYSRFVKSLCEKYKLPVVSLCGTRRVVPQTWRMILDAGPREFLGLFKNASVVCTDSFHGTVFSIDFKKDFFCFESAQSLEKSVNSRLYNILEKLGIVSRIFSCLTDMQEFDERIADEANSIDYAAADQLLMKERALSLRYLRRSLLP